MFLIKVKNLPKNIIYLKLFTWQQQHFLIVRGLMLLVWLIQSVTKDNRGNSVLN